MQFSVFQNIKWFSNLNMTKLLGIFNRLQHPVENKPRKLFSLIKNILFMKITKKCFYASPGRSVVEKLLQKIIMFF